MHRARSLSVATAALVAAVAAPASAAEIATEVQPTSVAAYGGVVVWSHSESVGSPYRLRAFVDGQVADLPVRSRSIAFDVDVGPDRRGRPVAVYSRCRREPRTRAWPEGRGCDLYRFSFATRREDKLRAVSRRDASETLPSVWRGRIAFARVYDRRRPKSDVPYLYLGGLRAGERRHRLGGGTVGRFEVIGDEAKPSGAATSIDLRGRRVTYGWSVDLPSQRGDDGESGDPPPATQVWVETRSSRRRLAQSCTPNALLSPIFAGGAPVWLRQLGDRATVLMPGDRPAPEDASSVAADGERLFYVTSTQEGPYRIVDDRP